MSARIVKPEDGLEEAAEILRGGGIIAFPTETVYGLGANALDAAAVAKIYVAKGRPASNPVIVHVPDVAAARELASEWPKNTERLAAQFWPGPLTLVVPKAAHIPDIVTAGGPTIGIRIPSHPVALELLRRAAVPVAAPSANRSEEVSPTTAQHVADSLGAFVDDLLVLDGGPSMVGLESTVLDVSQCPPRLLRPGMVSRRDLEPYLNTIIREATPYESGIARSPGQRVRHYAPRTPVVLIPAGELRGRVYSDDGLICCDDYQIAWGVKRLVYLTNDPAQYAAHLYGVLREMDLAGVSRIAIETPPNGPEWAAIHDRLRRAAAKKGVSE